MKFCTIVSYLLIFTNHRRFKHGVVVSERVFFCNDKTIMAYCSIWWVCGCEILHHCELFVSIHYNHRRFQHGVVVSERVLFCNDKAIMAPSGGCVAVKFSTIVSYLLISTNHRRFKHGVVVNEKVFSAMIRPLRLILLHLLSVQM